MTFDEQAYIQLCKAQIEKKYVFGNGQGYTQRDLELLAINIEEKTGVRLSLSTLKRLWKGEFKQSPQIATLNALASILDYDDWQSFKLENRPTRQPAEKPIRSKQIIWAIVVLVLLFTGTVIIWYKPSKRSQSTPSLKINGPIHFSTKKTVTSGIPNTVIFNYDVSQVDADSFYIQQSWNKLNRVAIDPLGKAYSSIYYESGYHRARLIANDSTVAMQPVHILSNGWEPHVYYSYDDQQPIHFENERFIEQGRLHISESLLKKRNVDLSRYFFSRVSYSAQFGASSHNFNLISKIKVDRRGDSLCPWMEMIVVTEENIFSVNMQGKGCENKAGYKMGEIIRSGQDNDLSALGENIYDWQELGLRVQNKQAKIVLNGKVIFEETFQNDFGNIMGLIYLFDGTGSIDYVRLDNVNGEVVFEDDFTMEQTNIGKP